jgi:hypothetical protein
VKASTRRHGLLLTASFARTLARVAAGLDDAEVCDQAGLLELLSLADRAEAALNVLEREGPDGRELGAS